MYARLKKAVECDTLLAMSTVTIPKIEYDFLKKRATAYERVLSAVSEALYPLPPTKSRSEVMKGFRASKRYNTAFLKSLKKGLEDSTYFNKP